MSESWAGEVLALFSLGINIVCRCIIEERHLANGIYKSVNALAREAVGEDKGFIATHKLRITPHNLPVGVYVGLFC